jgi:beta-glucuronidase
MIRRFREHDLRPVADLRGVWDLAFLGEVDPQTVDPAAVEFDDRMAVPGCFDATPAYAGKRGLAAYRLRVEPIHTPRQRLVFDGVHHWCRVFVNGRALGDHVGGFTRFSFDFETPAEDEIEITVLVDNRFDYERCPLHLDYMDWYHYGGLARGVELHGLEPVWIDGLRVDTEDLDARRIALTIRCASADETEAPLVVNFDGQAALQEFLSLPAGPTEITRTLEFPEAALWSPEEPNLHLLHVRLGDDDLRERVGIRQVAVDGGRILLNGQPIRLVGVNRHESHVQIGHGLPDALLVADAQLVRDLGCNFVRGSHYPQDVRWLDLCDEMGFLVWSEVLGWQHTAKHLTDERFIEAQLTNLHEMVDVACTHPSVIIYGILNESRSDDPACRPGYRTLLDRLRALDPTRLLTYASCHPQEDVCFDLVDVITINTYPGWYHGATADIPKLLGDLESLVAAKGFADKPLMIGEIGAGAIWGWRDWNARHWSEQYQAEVLEAALTHLLADSGRWCGVALWQFCDIRSSEQTHRALGRPRSFNNKGLVDEYRRPKQAYDLVKRHFRAARGKS